MHVCMYVCIEKYKYVYIEEILEAPSQETTAVWPPNSYL